MNKRRTKLIRAVAMLLVILLVLGMFIGAFAQFASAKEKGETFTVGFDAEFPPYGYQDSNGEFVGFDLDLAQEVCDRNGWELVKQPIDWDSKDMELKSGNIDCIWNGFTMNGREDDYTWSTPYVDNSQVVIVPENSDVQKLEDLAGKNVVVQNDSSALAAFTGEDATEENIALCASFAELEQVADYNTAFMDLDSGIVDAVCMDVGVANYQLERRDQSYRILDEYVSTEQYGIGFKKGNYELRDQVQKTLNEMVEDGTFDEIAEKWDLSDSVCLADTMTMQFDDESADAAAAGTSSGSTKSGIPQIIKELSAGLLATCAIFFLTLLFSMPLGLLITFIRRSKNVVLRWIAKIYISVLRGTPLMLQLILVFYGPSILFGLKLSASWRFVAVIIGFAINYAAYFAEIFRSGIQGVPKGQSEAAQVLGFTKRQTFVHIIFPQMVKRVMPPVTNEVITLVKDTSLAFAIAYTEMFTIAQRIVARDANLMPIFVAGIFYYIFNALVAAAMSAIEKKLAYFE